LTNQAKPIAFAGIRVTINSFLILELPFNSSRQPSLVGLLFVLGIERTTFVIDSKGTITKIYNKVKVPGHIDAVLNDV
jgi:hypothetical protein